MTEPNNIRIREIPYNYTSFSDREIVIRFLGKKMWDTLNELRGQRVTGRSARMLFEILGDMWAIMRNPYLQDDLLSNRKRCQALVRALYHRLRQIEERAANNKLALELAQRTRQAIQTFENWLIEQRKNRILLIRKLKNKISRDKMDFSPIARVSHATDASDWRVEYPLAVFTPSSEAEIIKIIQAATELNLTIIPRGGGTGYTGSAVPLYSDTLIINLEKLDTVSPVRSEEIAPGISVEVIEAGSGAVTKRVTLAAEKKNLIFAVDPTSLNSSTIGGNISMNAGGKKAVAWGTTLDNLLAWRLVGPDAVITLVERLEHNQGKIPREGNIKFRITRFHPDGKSQMNQPAILSLPGKIFRKKGLGKDVTDKVLGGLPGVQKEGCDGIITWAKFILYPNPACTFTLCLEFYDQDLTEAVLAIEKIINYLHTRKGVFLAALEHLDERYIKAINYNTRSARATRPKMVLLADISGENESAVKNESQKIISQFVKINAEGFIAESSQARQNFWADRSNTAAIAKHTNAFKINEDVVIPIRRLAEYNRGLERLNIEYSITNKLRIIEVVLAYLKSGMPELMQMKEYVASREREKIIQDKINGASAALLKIRDDWQGILGNLDKPASLLKKVLSEYGSPKFAKNDKIIDLLLKRAFRISYKEKVENILNEIFGGSELEEVRKKFKEIHGALLTSRLFIATHMHAGDGNVHTNIPVNSNDYNMIQEADFIVKKIMALVKKLDGEISGEHGIGLTKYEYLDDSRKKEFASFKAKIDPKGLFNRGKLLAGADLGNAYTPSFRLLRQEALILEQSELETLNDQIRNCLRCGKCKYTCSTHVPRANLLYSPRNKILATSSLMEAFLYEEQTRRGISTLHFRELNILADHCTVCHKCKKACPVDIDFGNVSIDLRYILKNRGKRKTNLGHKFAQHYLKISDFKAIYFYFKVLLRGGFFAQRSLYRLIKLFQPSKLPQKNQHECPSTNDALNLTNELRHSLSRPLPKLPQNTLRHMLDLEEWEYVPIIHGNEPGSGEQEAVFYFPGCGSEKIYSQISLAVVAVLHSLGIQIVLPPKFLCCGYPQMSSGDKKESRRIAVENSVLFHRIANTLNYLDIRTIITSCGTCMDQLEKYELKTIFPQSRILDIHEFLFQKGLSAAANDSSHKKNSFIYHDPCHSPLKNSNAQKVVNGLLGSEILFSDRCCGESGTFAVTRPDISSQVKFRKEEEILLNKAEILDESEGSLEKRRVPNQDKIKILTTCPSCLQGLSRYRDAVKLNTSYIIEEIALRRLGKNWQKDFLKKADQTMIEKALL
jgi:FAD/FMN-containing dehydrogenase/heterodisulfide reductase subunit C